MNPSLDNIKNMKIQKEAIRDRKKARKLRPHGTQGENIL